MKKRKVSLILSSSRSIIYCKFSIFISEIQKKSKFLMLFAAIFLLSLNDLCYFLRNSKFVMARVCCCVISAEMCVLIIFNRDLCFIRSMFRYCFNQKPHHDVFVCAYLRAEKHSQLRLLEWEDIDDKEDLFEAIGKCKLQNLFLLPNFWLISSDLFFSFCQRCRNWMLLFVSVCLLLLLFIIMRLCIWLD